ncbi:Uncharacterised protein [Mycobacterium tuberculosis]|uniref:Uncharacterized protein n=1 Tax=Mycobacterium tuberculosis TaxID=1773 RepID=A0A916PBY5_MYCTX|nr:Uncharacterised protein [Mycobacterium tuberculosis]
MIKMDATLGTTWPTMIRRLETPIYRAALMNSRSRKLIVIPRTMRELIIQPKPANNKTRNMMFAEFLVRGVTMAIRMKLGTTSSRSTTHISVRSRQPPKYPEIAPTVAAIPVEITATQTPISIDFCMPRSVCASRSWPSALVPSQCLVPGGCSNALKSRSS